MKTKYWWSFSISFLLAASSALHAAEPAANDGSAALRVALRDKTLELRTVQSDLAALQANQGAIADENKAVTAKYEALKKQIAVDRTAIDKSVAALTAQAAEQKQLVTRLNDALEKAKTEGEKAAQAAQVAEAMGAKLTNQNILLERRAADRETKNLALFLVANEILSRYEEFSLGNAIRAKEPFVGLTRTKLENLVQDYQDKIQESRVRP
jgi:chromosome segregation ATPase